ncbi:HEAT repeat domain-containing protein, partial [Burkholderia multivorans]
MTSSASAFPPSDAYDADDADHAALLARLAASDASVRRV